MSLDVGSITALIVSVTTAIGWVLTQAQRRNKSQRDELRGRRKLGLLRARYVFRLEESLAREDHVLPPKPDGLEELEKEQW